jgi:hypothetical protein
VHSVASAEAALDSFTTIPLRLLGDVTSDAVLDTVWAVGAALVVALAVLLPARRRVWLAVLTGGVLVGASVVVSSEVRDLSRADQRWWFADASPSWVDDAADRPVLYLQADTPLWGGVWKQAFWNERVDAVANLRSGSVEGPIPTRVVAPRFDGLLLDVDGKRIGVARGVKKALIGKVIGAKGGGSDRIASAIQWAVNEGANVISMSLGMDFPGFQKRLIEQFGFPPELATSRALEGYRANVQLFEALAKTVRSMSGFGKASIIVAAAGNESRTDENPDFKIAVSPPAVSDGIISVAALGKGPAGFVVAPFSNRGAMVAGPGVEITSAKPGGGLTTMSGTSMATPHVAGVAALWAQKLKAGGPLNPGLLSTRLVGSGITSNLAVGFDPSDIGSGMVTAPQG